MKITELLKKDGVKLGVSAATQAEAIDELVDLQVACGAVNDRAKYRQAVLDREAQFSTAVGEGIAIPHAKTAAVSKAGLVAITVPAGVDWKAPDGKPSDLIFLIAAPDTQANVHLEVLAKLSALLMHADFAAALRAAKTPEEFLAAIDKAEAEHDAEQAAKEAKAAAAKAAREAAAAGAAAPAADTGLPQVLAITACPTGIAHTYMAAENLEKVAEQMGVTIKVETQGSVGTKNALTAEEIAACKGIIIAADKGIELGRFNGKPLYSTNVSAGINDAEKLINIIMNGEAPICHAEGGSSAPAASASTEGIGSTVYKHLMNGVFPHAAVRRGRRHPHGHLLLARPGRHGHELLWLQHPARRVLQPRRQPGVQLHAADPRGLHLHVHRRPPRPSAWLCGRLDRQAGLHARLPLQRHGRRRAGRADLGRLHRGAVRGFRRRLPDVWPREAVRQAA